MNLALFDLDHTLLSGDSDALWCDFLMDEGVLDRSSFAARNAQMEADYKAGSVDAQAFAGFYVSTLAGRSPEQWQSLRQRFLHEVIAPRIPHDAHALVRGHLQAGDLVVMTTATNRFITELTAQHLGIAHLIATEAQLSDGRFTGCTEGVLNMRAGKVQRLHAWLQLQGRRFDAFAHTVAYSDSINDLPLLQAVREPVAVDPDAKLHAHAQAQGWRVLRLRR